MIAALFVQAGGVYSGLSHVDLWDEQRDARLYAGPHPVVAHPPCQRWGRYWQGGPSAKVRRLLGDDDGCFAAALAAVRRWGGVLEHPKDSHAWRRFGLTLPSAQGGWVRADESGGWTCCVEQGHYGHAARKATWLYAVGCELPELKWGSSGQRLSAVILERHGYAKARRRGVIEMIGGKHKTEIRQATPPDFRDVLLRMVASVQAGSASVRACA